LKKKVEKGLPFEDHPNFLKVETICPLANAPKVTSTNKTRKNKKHIKKQKSREGDYYSSLLFFFLSMGCLP
jgi:hypothetical protein